MTNHVVIAGSFPFPTGSAAASRIRNFALGLAENGVQVHLLAMAPVPVPQPESGIRIYCTGVTYERLANWRTPDGRLPLRNSLTQKPGWFVKAYGAAWPAYWKLKKKIEINQCDLLLVYGRSILQILPLVKLSRANKVVTIIDVVEIRDQFDGFGGKLSPIYWDRTLGEKWMPKIFDGYSLIANALVPFFSKQNGKEHIIIPAISSWKEFPDIITRSEGSVFRVMYLGALLARDAPYMLFDLIDAIVERRLPVQFDIVGKYHESRVGQELHEKYSKNPDYDGYVNWFGQVDDEALKARYIEADGFILPRRDQLTEWASFPTRLVEYLHQAKPVFAANVGDIGMYLRDGIDAFLFPPDDARKAADMIEIVVNSPDRGRVTGLQGRQRGAECFDRGSHAKRLLDFADNVRKVEKTA